MTLSTIKDIELAALLAELLTSVGFAHAWGFGPLVYAGIANAINEIGARGNGSHLGRTMFERDGDQIDVDWARFTELIELIARDLERAGFAGAGAAMRADALLVQNPTLAADGAGVARIQASEHLH